MTEWKPATYPSLSPYLVSPNADLLITFLAAAFDGVVERRIDRPDGTLRHAEVRIDDSIIMIGGSPDAAPMDGVHLHLYVPDVQIAFDKAIAAGATVVQIPERKDAHDDLRCGVRNPSGVTWWIATQ